ncbi:heterokaryon incompatibility protein-domain-containing protein [Hypoxylon trugodes]|uniref:heterokaryon incompatibility protein-domain-containing protein n=1 Tax=Hypoxylon trugodes TaxID=326681 RepID=UPI00219260BA|nr:heterokaryon incompatibility protein-domain-containing protein [Hypoxylon trugodes]KAI1390009.1 heterokaryon incompatibility protein-domain-containing protein [Hypoxylon trugodes]
MPSPPSLGILCSTHCLPSRKRWIQLIKNRRRSNHARDDSETNGGLGVNKNPESFPYSIVPLHRRPRKRLRKRGCSDDVASPSKKIRLLKILPNRSGDLIACDLRAVDLHDATYDALSYTWGPTTRKEAASGMDSERRYPIMCNNKRLLVTVNLFSCLEQLEKNRHYHRDLWIDAICINQNDPPERNQQVQIMGDIYRSAERVIVWLGPSYEDAKPAWESIKALNDLPKDEKNNILPARIPHMPNDDNWDSLASLFARSWFSRIWVVQELVLARETTILCGDYTFDWSDMVSVSDFMSRQASTNTFKAHSSRNSGTNLLSYKNPSKLDAIRRDKNGGNAQVRSGDILLRNMVRCRTYEASKDLDKVYSLLGLADPGLGCRLLPDYEKEVSEVYIDAAKYILENTDDLHILAHAEGEDFKRVTGLPTWVPDWGVKEHVGLRITGW